MAKQDELINEKIAYIVSLGGPLYVEDLTNFNYESYEHFQEAAKSKLVQIGSRYNSRLAEFVLTKSEYFIHICWTNFPYLVILVNVILAIYYRNWLLLLGIPAAIIGFLASSPGSFFKRVADISALAFVGSFFLGNWIFPVIIGSLFWTFIVLNTARSQLSKAIEELSLTSEIFFCYFLYNKHIFLVDENFLKTIAKLKL